MKRDDLQRSLDFKEPEAGNATDSAVMKQGELQVFDFEGKQTRIVMKDGTPWWVGKDVCDILGYANSRDSLEKHCKHKEKVTVAKRDGQNGGAQFLTVIPESDVYRLIIRSNMPGAERFETWVMEEVLPSIRKYGAYMTPQANEAMTDTFIPLSQR